MKMIKTVMAGAIAMSLVTFGAAADAGQGVINFKGKVIDAPCSIDAESADQSIDFGQISKSVLANGGISQQKPVTIKLVNCDTSAVGQTVKASFSGMTVASQPGELGTTGNTGTAVVMSAADGSMVTFNGSKGAALALQEGNNILQYSAWVKKATNATAVNEGEFTAVTNFALAYE